MQKLLNCSHGISGKMKVSLIQDYITGRIIVEPHRASQNPGGGARVNSVKEGTWTTWTEVLRER